MSSFDELMKDTAKKEQSAEDKKKAFAEQQAARREKCFAMIDEGCKTATVSGESMRKLLDVESRFDKYTIGNDLLIYMQKPDATVIKDFKTWEKDGKRIKKGAKSLMILEPHDYIAQDGTQRTGYNAKLMFDISDIEKPEMPPKVARDIKMIVRALVEDCPVKIATTSKVDYPPDMPEGAYYDPDKNRIVAVAGITPVEIFSSVAQAMAHAEMAANQLPDAPAYSISDHAFQARCAAYVLAQKYGVQTDKVNIVSVPPRYANMEAKEIKAELTEIHTSVQSIVERMNRVLEPKVQNKDRDSRDER